MPSKRTSLTPNPERTPTPSQRRRIAAEYRRQIRHLKRCTTLLHFVDARIYDAGMTIFTHEAGLADWLSTPARALRNRVPLEVMRTPTGRKAVAQVLLAIAHGTVL